MCNSNYVESRPNSRNVNDDFEHLVAQATSWTLESGAESTMSYGVLKFGTLDEVRIGDDLGRVDDEKTTSFEAREACSDSRPSGARSSHVTVAYQ